MTVTEISMESIPLDWLEGIAGAIVVCDFSGLTAFSLEIPGEMRHIVRSAAANQA